MKAIPGQGSLTVLCDFRSLSKPRLKLSVGTHSGGHFHRHVVWTCLPVLPAQKVSFGSCCPSLSSLEDFQQGNKKVFLCWANIYITNIQCLCLITNIPACKWEAFLGKGGTGNREVIHSYHCICLKKSLETAFLWWGNVIKITKSGSQKLSRAGVEVVYLTLVPVLSDYLIYLFGFRESCLCPLQRALNEDCYSELTCCLKRSSFKFLKKTQNMRL